MPTIVSVELGGTGANNTADARAALGVASSSVSNAAYSQANSAYAQANLAYTQANTATTNAGNAHGQANSAYGAANTAQTTAQNAYSQANNSYGQANNAYNQANTATTIAGDAFNQANTATTIAGNAYGQANTAQTTAQNAYSQANLAYTQANSAYSQSNNAYTQANSAYSQANSGYTQANSAYAQANLAYTQANTAFTAANNSNLKLGGVITGTLNVTNDVIVGGNVYLQGNTTYINVSTYQINDSLMYIAANNTLTDSVDIGFVGAKNTSGTFSHTGFARDATDGKYKLFDNLPDAGHVGNVIDFANSTVATLVANVEANRIILGGNTVATQANLTLAHNQANSAYGQANLAYTQANSAYGQANLAYTQANSAYGQANLAYTQANNAYAQANLGYTQANTATTIGQNAYGQANLAYTAANNAVLKAGDTMTGSLIFTADRSVAPNTGGGSFINIINSNTTSSAIGSILFSAYDAGSSARHGGAIVFNKEVNWGAGAGYYPGVLSFYTRGAGDTTERMKIDSSGIVSVGFPYAANAQTTSYGAFGTSSKLTINGDLNIIRVGAAPAFGQRYARGSDGSPTSVDDGDRLGAHFFGGYHSGLNSGAGGWTNPCFISASVEGSTSTVTSALPAYLSFSTTAINGSRTERLRITSNGFIGIGTTSPVSLLNLSAESGAINIFSDVYGATATFQSRAANGTRTSPTALTSDTFMSFFGSRGHDGTAFSGSAAVGISCFAGGTWTSTSWPTYITFGTTAASSTTRTERMRIDSAGNVGIGTSSPEGILHVKSTSAYPAFLFESANTAIYAGPYLNLRNPSLSTNFGETSIQHTLLDPNDLTNVVFQIQQRTTSSSFVRQILVYDYKNQNWSFLTNGSERMKIDSSGNVGIGTASPGTKLTVAASVEAGARFLGNGLSSAGLFVGYNSAAYVYNDSNTDMIFGTNAAERMRLTAAGYVGIGIASPASKLEVSGSGTQELRISSTSGFGAANLTFYSDRGTGSEWRPAYMQTADNGTFTGRLDFYTNGSGSGNRLGSSLAMSIVNGQVGIGTTSPSSYGKFAVVAGNTYFYVASSGFWSSVFGPRSAGDGFCSVGMYYNNSGGYWKMDSASGAFTFYENGTLRASISNTGQLQSYATTGTAPLVVASTTAVANLNADLLDGLNSTDYMRNSGMLDNADTYMNFRVMRNANSVSNRDGMYIGYGNANGGNTRLFGGGLTSGDFIKYSDHSYEPGSFRAPIFYDSNDTNYYSDPAGTSLVSAITARSNLQVYNTSGGDWAWLYLRGVRGQVGIHHGGTNADASTDLRFAFYNADGSWYDNRFHFYKNGDFWMKGTTLTIGESTFTSINMTDSDEGTRTIHCNSNRIGFLNQSGGWGSYCNDDGSWQTDYAVWTPILYDLNDSGYYLNPNSTSSLYALATAGQISARYGQSVGTMLTATGGLGGIEVYSGGTTHAAFINFHKPGNWASYFGIDTDNQFAVGGWSAGAALAHFKCQGLGVGTASSGTAGEIRATNNITAYYSDSRLKEIKGKITNAVNKVMQLNGYYYVENELAESFGYNNKEEQVGVSAQEVEAVLPHVVAAAPFDIAKDEDGKEYSKSGENYKTVRYERLVPLLIEAIKEQQKLIESLQEKVVALENK